MKSASLATILAILALAGVGVVYLKLENLGDQLRPLTHGRASRSNESAGPVSYERPEPAGPARQGDESVASEPAAQEAPSFEERLARLERTVEERSGGPGARLPAGRMLEMPRFVRDLDDLASALDLRSAQKDRVGAAIERGQRRIDEILMIPDEEGKSPHERRQERRRKLEEAMKGGSPGGVLAMAFDGLAYRNRKIPGRNETYGQEIDRIRRETRQEIEACLDPEQRETFDDTRLDAVLGGGEAMSVAVVRDGGEGTTVTANEIHVEMAQGE